MLGWTQPDLHGAALQSVKVVASTALGPNFFGFANSEYLYTSPGSLLNVTANLSQPLQFAIQVTSDVGQSPLSPWLSFSKLALPSFASKAEHSKFHGFPNHRGMVS